jgi:hypothetical protein
MREAAGIVQLVGLMIMAYGVWRTWEDFGPPGHIWGPPLAAIRAALQRLIDRLGGWVRRILRRPARGEAAAGMAEGVGVAVDARARVIHPPVDPSDPRAAIGVLDGRVRQLTQSLADLQERVQDEGTASRAAADELSERLEREVADLRARDQRVAVGGIQWETLGLLVTGAGLVLQTLFA